MLSRWAYILIGDNNTGKTSFQKHVLSELCDKQYQALPSNRVFKITHPRMLRGIATLSTMGRSFQEVSGYGSVERFFKKKFKTADVCILSSHAKGSAINDVEEMIRELRLLGRNVAAVFFSNGYNANAKNISLLHWDERLWLDNPQANSDSDIQMQIERLAKEFAQLLVARGAQQ